MIPKHLFGALALMVLSSSALATESWTCTYQAFNSDRAVTVTIVINGNKLDKGGIHYDVLENNQYSLIGAEHYSQFDQMKGAVRIFSSTVIIDKTFGQFIYMVGEIGSEPGYRKGHCAKD